MVTNSNRFERFQPDVTFFNSKMVLLRRIGVPLQSPIMPNLGVRSVIGDGKHYRLNTHRPVATSERSLTLRSPPPESQNADIKLATLRIVSCVE